MDYQTAKLAAVTGIAHRSIGPLPPRTDADVKRRVQIWAWPCDATQAALDPLTEAAE